ncbi:MAG: Gfo/Idh/MocA family oxidoreductase [Lacrimispora sp.]
MNIGIIGAGLIVPDFLEACRDISSITVRSICARERNLEKMNQLSEKYGIEKIFTDYEDLLNDDVDGIYVAVPNHLHYQFAKEALKHKKHVILEKPFTSSYDQARDLVETAEENHVILFEAISNQYLPNYEKVKELLPELGGIKIAHLNFSQYSRRYDLFKEGTILPVFDPEKSGGALMDLNVYNIHFLLGLFGKPDRVTYIANIERGIDTSGILTLEYPGFQCAAIGAKDCKAPAEVSIQGDKGCIYANTPSSLFESFTFLGNDGREQEYALNEGKSRMYFELKYFAGMVERQDFEEAGKRIRQTLDVMEILDAGRKQVGVRV